MTPLADAAPLNTPPLGWALLLAAVAWAVVDVRKDSAQQKLRWPWWALVAAALACFRWPLLWVPHQLNPDESQLIAGAITLRHDPLFWRSVDGGTAGPLDFFPLLPAAWVSGVASFAVARAISLAAIFASLVFAGETLALVAGATVARLAVLPALAFFALTTNPDFVHASTEVMPVLLLAAAGWLLARQTQSPSGSRAWLIAVLLGAVPWSKLQATPLALALWALAARSEARASRSLLPLVAGALAPTLLASAFATATGQIEHLVTPYIRQNLAYVGAPQFSWAGTLVAQWQLAWLDGYLGFWLASAAVLALVALARLRAAPWPQRRDILIALALLAAGAFSAIGPRRPSPHHLQLLLLPLLWFSGAALALRWTRTRSRLLATVFLAASVAPQLAWRARGIDAFAAMNQSTPSTAHRQLAELVQRFSSTDEPLAIWGWRSSLYVEAGRRQATRQAHTEAQIYPSALQSYFLRRYLEDFQTASPPVFVDAVGPGNFAFEAPQFAHEAFPPLREWVRARYTHVATLDGARLFLRHDRLTEAKLALPDSPAP